MIGRILGRQPVPDLDVANPPEAYRRAAHASTREIAALWTRAAEATRAVQELAAAIAYRAQPPVTEAASDPHSPEETQ